MIGFRDFILERLVDGVSLARRVARRYGKTNDYPGHDDAETDENMSRPLIGGHIPLSGYSERDTDAMLDRRHAVMRRMTADEYAAAHSVVTHDIDRLLPTQEYVKTSNDSRLRAKVAETRPTNVKTATHMGRTFVLDGHHAIMAARMRGERTIASKHIDLDAYPK
jgi:hypothetical protein